MKERNKETLLLILVVTGIVCLCLIAFLLIVNPIIRTEYMCSKNTVYQKDYYKDNTETVWHLTKVFVSKGNYAIINCDFKGIRSQYL
jgi:nucleoside recognition membrane protein YjiH